MNMLANKISTVLGRHPKGEVGLEIEVEGVNLPLELDFWWNRVNEGSLREGGYEYVLSKPVIRSSVPKTIRCLNKEFVKCGTVPLWSQRTSVHVHINVQEMSFYEGIKFAALYYIFEDALTSNFTKARQGNNFCLRLKDAMGTVLMLKDALAKGRLDHLDADRWKYGALNLSTIFKFGSLEFRAMEGNTNEDYICNWVNVLLALKDTSLRYESISDIVDAFSLLGVEGFTKDALTLRDVGDVSGFVTKTEGWEGSILDGLWRIQDLAYVQKDAEAPAVKGVPKHNKVGIEAFFDREIHNMPKPRAFQWRALADNAIVDEQEAEEDGDF